MIAQAIGLGSEFKTRPALKGRNLMSPFQGWSFVNKSQTQGVALGYWLVPLRGAELETNKPQQREADVASAICYSGRRDVALNGDRDDRHYRIFLSTPWNSRR